VNYKKQLQEMAESVLSGYIVEWKTRGGWWAIADHDKIFLGSNHYEAKHKLKMLANTGDRRVMEGK
jgi:hypothetical protein